MVVATTHKTTDLEPTVGTAAALRPNETTSPLCHLDSPHKPLRTASSMALRPDSSRVLLEVGTAVVAAGTTRDPGKKDMVNTVRVATAKAAMIKAEVATVVKAGEVTIVKAGEATASKVAAGTVMEVEATEMVAVEEAKTVEEGTRKSSQRATEQLQ
jgi:hypothetical protein